MESYPIARPLRVAFVDDEPWALLGIQEIVDWEEFGFKCSYAFTNAEETLETLRNHPVDVLVTDIRLPEMSGLELIKKLKEESLVKECVVVSAYRDFDFAKYAISQGVLYYLLKPLQPCEVIKAISLLYEAFYGNRKVGAPYKLVFQKEDYTSPTSETLRLLDEAAVYPNCYLQIFSNEPDATYGNKVNHCNRVKVCFNGFSVVELISCKKPIISASLKPGVSRGHSDFSLLQAMIKEAELSFRLGFNYCSQNSVSEVQLFIANNIEKQIRISDLSYHFSISEVYLSECFKRHTGTTIGAFVIQLKMNMATDYLLKTDLTVSEIADKLGYSDAGYFGRIFRKKFGVPPALFRLKQNETH